MKYKIGTFLGLVLATSLTVTAAYCQNSPSPLPSPTQSSDFKEGDVVDYERNATTGEVVSIKRKVGVLKGLDTSDIDEPEFWKILAMTLVAGALGGLVAELISLNGNIEWPHRPSEDEWAKRLAEMTNRDVAHLHIIDLGVFARLSIGSLAAPAAMVLLNPNSVFALFGMSVVAGSAGAAIFIALQERIKTALVEQRKAVEVAVAQKEKEIAQEPSRQAKLKQSAQLIGNKLNEAAEKLEIIEAKLRKASTTDPNVPDKLKFSNDQTVDLEQDEFNAVWQVLNEIKGIDEQIGQRITQSFKVLEDKIKSLAASPMGGARFEVKGGELELADFNQVKKFINEARGEISAIEAASNGGTTTSNALTKTRASTF